MRTWRGLLVGAELSDISDSEASGPGFSYNGLHRLLQSLCSGNMTRACCNRVIWDRSVSETKTMISVVDLADAFFSVPVLLIFSSGLVQL